jgi:phospholipid/cholesterol/gamma-HCH transport system substrate-binding protein
MARQLKAQVRNVIPIVVMLALGLVITWVILQEQRLRIPILEERPFELKAEFETAQAVVPGQGQTIRVAGVRVGDVEKVELVDGAGVVTFAIDREFLPIYRDATILMRPTTGLKDMFFHLDPGSRAAGEYEEGEVVPMTNTAPDVNFHDILSALDGETRSYLRLLLVGAGKGLDDRDRELGKLLGSLGPINRNMAELNRTVAERRHELARFTHNLRVLTTRVGQAEEELTRLVSSSSQYLGEIAEQDPDVRRLVRNLPGMLSEGRRALISMRHLAQVMGPAFNELRPFARNLEYLNESSRRFAETVTPVIRDEIRPFVREARARVPDIRRGATRFAATAPRLETIFAKLNRLANMAAHNPRGPEPAGTPGRDEGYLFWVSWLANNTTQLFSSGDGNGFYRRVYLTMGCDQANALIENPNPALQLQNQLITGLTDPVLAEVCGE